MVTEASFVIMKGVVGCLSLSALERETIICWNDSDSKRCYVYSSQQSMIRKLLNNPLFVIRNKNVDMRYRVYPCPVSVDGFLPLRCLTIRTKIRRLSDEQKKEMVRRLKLARKRF